MSLHVSPWRKAYRGRGTQPRDIRASKRAEWSRPEIQSAGSMGHEIVVHNRTIFHPAYCQTCVRQCSPIQAATMAFEMSVGDTITRI